MFFVKTFHVHTSEKDKCCHHSHRDQASDYEVDSSHECQICHLLLTPFIESPIFKSDLQAIPIPMEFETREIKPFSCKIFNFLD